MGFLAGVAMMGAAMAGFVRAIVGAGGCMKFVLAPVVFPMERLQVAQIVRTALQDRDDMIDLPTVAALGNSIILADHGPSPSVHAKGREVADGLGLKPNRFDERLVERIARDVRIWFPVPERVRRF